MVNNSTNINKANNYLSPQTIAYKKRDIDIRIRNTGPGWGQTEQCVGFNRFIGFQPQPPSW
jgi:hypothetical protein